jgi:hypothetical protein
MIWNIFKIAAKAGVIEAPDEATAIESGRLKALTSRPILPHGKEAEPPPKPTT